METNPLGELLLKAVLRVFVNDSYARPVAGATVSILDNSGKDVTGLFLGSDKQKTSDLGLAYTINPNPVVTPSIYTIRVTADGYKLSETKTDATFDGRGTYTIVLVSSAINPSSFTVVPPADFVSRLKPIVYTITIPDGVDITYIKAKVLMSTGVSSYLRVPTYGKKEVRVDIANRVRLGVLPTFVPSGKIAVEDLQFSDVFTVSFSVDTPTGEVTLQDSEGDLIYNHVAANFFVKGENDLSQYAKGVRKWIAPFSTPTYKAGYYADVMIWLPTIGQYAYYVRYEYFDSIGDSIEQSIFTIQSSNHIQRIAIDATPPEGSQFVELAIYTEQGEIMSETLKVYYIYES